jgi:hypothetical protein
MTANTVITRNTTATPSSLRVADAQMHFFASKEEYQAFQSAWKALANSGEKLSASLYAAHAILHGRDLYKTFSPNRRPHQASEPYIALAQALSSLPYMAQMLERQALPITPEQKAALMAGVTKAGVFVTSQKLSSMDLRTALLTGKAEFAQPAPAEQHAVEA